ncbi:MAG: hypothetical protein IRY85_20290 [Micromonosporaceae bacterium]|nr:hypothetical protein [Micromonosporaceae bacterium]
MVLLKQVVADADKATGLWHELGEIGRSLAEQRAWLNREELVARLRSAGHDLATGVRASTTATELLARQLSAWQEKLGLAEHDAWQKLTYGLNQEIPAIRSDRLDALEALAAWLLGQSWPTTFPRVRIAFIRHAYALRALLSALRNYTEAHGSARRLERLYQRLERWDPPEYQRLLRETQLRQQVIWYLVTELSRSVNLIIQAVREEVDPGFRIVEGLVLSMEPGIMNMYLVRAVRELGLGRSSAIPVARTDQVGDRGQGCGKWY